MSGSLTDVTFIILVVAVFFLASAGASAAYLTASEIFPMETRALAIAFFATDRRRRRIRRDGTRRRASLIGLLPLRAWQVIRRRRHARGTGGGR